jgi:hypothetical protein
LGYLVALTEPKEDAKPDEKLLGWAVKMLTTRRSVPFEDVVLDIATRVGMLERRSRLGEQESLWTWRRLQSTLLEIIEGKGLNTDEGTTTHIESVEIHQLPGKVIAVRPRNLSAALMLHCVQSVAIGMELALCKSCGGPFLRGGGRGTNKRDSTFCEPRCKSAYYNKLNRA